MPCSSKVEEKPVAVSPPTCCSGASLIVRPAVASCSRPAGHLRIEVGGAALGTGDDEVVVEPATCSPDRTTRSRPATSPARSVASTQPVAGTSVKPPDRAVTGSALALVAEVPDAGAAPAGRRLGGGAPGEQQRDDERPPPASVRASVGRLGSWSGRVGSWRRCNHTVSAASARPPPASASTTALAPACPGLERARGELVVGRVAHLLEAEAMRRHDEDLGATDPGRQGRRGPAGLAATLPHRDDRPDEGADHRVAEGVRAQGRDEHSVVVALPAELEQGPRRGGPLPTTAEGSEVAQAEQGGATRR